jgi:TolB protein
MKQKTIGHSLMIWLVLCIALVADGCSGGSSHYYGPQSIKVISVTPAPNATGVAVTTMPSVTFDYALDLSTLETSSFTVTGPGGDLNRKTPTYDIAEESMTFAPMFPLANNVPYKAKVKAAGLAADYMWEFTTIARPLIYDSQRALDGSDAENTNGTSNIWVVNGDGSGAKPLTSLTNAGLGSGGPQWAPDGTKVVFVSTRKLDGSDAANTNGTMNIWVMNADGSGVKSIASVTALNANSVQPQWSPDGTKIVFASARKLDGSDAANANNMNNIWVVNADGTSGKPLTSLTSAASVMPQWSPDGTKIVFTSGRKLDGTDATNTNNTYNIWIVNADGTGAKPLTSVTAGNAGSTDPRWSPDGMKIVFTSHRKLDGSDAANANGTMNVWVMNADGTGVNALTSVTADADSDRPQWSPDGTKIVFESRRKLDGSDAANANNTMNIWMVNADGSGSKPLTSLTAAGADSRNPQWSQDGAKVVFDSGRKLDGSDSANLSSSYNHNIWIVNADGSHATPLTSITVANASSADPMW